MSNPVISVVSPVYRAEGIVDELVRQLVDTLERMNVPFEIVLVEDGSPDGSWNKIEENATRDKRIKGIRLSRNFGQHCAITAGLDHACGEWVVVMDCDLQDKPAEIKRMFEKAAQGYDVVLARRALRRDKLHRRLYSRMFYGVLGYLTGIKQDPAVANFGIYHRKVVEAVCHLREPIRYFPSMVRWVGFKTTTLDVEHGSRYAGETSYNFKRMFRLAADIILANSIKPITLTIKFGLLVAFLAFLFGLIILYDYFTGKITVLGYTSLFVSIWFLSGLILMVLGTIGLYLGKTFEGVKNRPIYIVKRQVNDDNET